MVFIDFSRVLTDWIIFWDSAKNHWICFWFLLLYIFVKLVKNADIMFVWCESFRSGLYWCLGLFVIDFCNEFSRFFVGVLLYHYCLLFLDCFLAFQSVFIGFSMVVYADDADYDLGTTAVFWLSMTFNNINCRNKGTQQPTIITSCSHQPTIITSCSSSSRNKCKHQPTITIIT